MNDTGKRMTYQGGADREPATGKGAYELVSPFALERIAIWYELGARKYADRNWEKGIPFGRLIQSALRHIIRWMKGDRSEDHLSAACWNIMAMMHFEETGQSGEWNNYPQYNVQPAKIDATAAPAKWERAYKIIAVDFDGCLCSNAWPGIGAPNKPIIDQLIKWRASGYAKLILWTCREGDALDRAVQWCREYGLEFDAVNANLPEMNALYGNDSRKCGADWYLDDKAVCARADGSENKWANLLT